MTTLAYILFWFIGIYAIGFIFLPAATRALDRAAGFDPDDYDDGPVEFMACVPVLNFILLVSALWSLIRLKIFKQ